MILNIQKWISKKSYRLIWNIWFYGKTLDILTNGFTLNKFEWAFNRST